MADVTFTIAIKDDGTPVLKQVQGAAQQMGDTVEAAGKRGAAGLAALATGAQTLAQRAETLGRTLSLSISAPLIGLGTAAAKMASDFESALSQIVGLVGVSREQVQAWREDLLALGPAVGKTPRELAEGLFFVTSAGLQGEAALEALTVSAQAAAAGLGETATVADAVTSAINAYGQENLAAARAAGILTAAVREGKAEASAIAPVLGQVLPVAAQLRVGFDEVAAGIAAMTRSGLSAGESATALRGILQALLRPTEEAKKELERIGVTSDALREKLGRDGLISTLSALTTAYQGNSEALGKIFSDTQALTGVLTLTGESAEATRKIFAALAQETGQSLAGAFQEASEQAGFKFQQAMAEVNVLLVRLGDAVLPAALPLLQRLTELVSSAAESFSRLEPATQNTLVTLAVLAAAGGPLALVVAKLGSLVALLSSPVGLAFLALAAGVGGAAVAISTLNTHIDELQGGLNDLSSEKLTQLFQEKLNTEGIAGLKRTLDGLQPSLASLPPALQALITKTSAWVAEMEKGGPVAQGVAVQIDGLGTAAATAAHETEKLGTGNKALSEEHKKLAEKLAEVNKHAREETATLQQKTAILKQVEAGTLSHASALEKIAVAELRAKGITEANARANVAAKSAHAAADKAIREEAQAYEALTKRIEAYKKELDATRPSLERQVQGHEVYLSTVKALIEEGKEFTDAQQEAQRQTELSTFAWEQYQKALDAGFPEPHARRLADEMAFYKDKALEATAAAEAFNKEQQALRAGALLTTKDLETLADGLLQGTQKNLPDALESIGQTMGLRLVKGVLFGKSQNEQAILDNFNSLLGIGAQGIFSSQGNQLGGSLISAIVDRLQLAPDRNLLMGGIKALFSGGDILTSVNTIFEGMGSLAAGALGFGLAEGLKGLFGFGGSAEAGLGGKIGGLVGGIAGSFFGPLGSFLGAFGGDLFGTLIGGLFAHTPTKGTQIRKGVKEFLKDIEVSFADEIDAGDYFFEETKKLAQKMFGGDFLAASKQILTETAGPELARQLQALGAALTAEQAKKLGKPLEQTATTFGNLLLDNLGVDAIPAAIAEIVEKAELSLASLVTVLNREFDAARIGEDFYRDAIAGAVAIFSTELPTAIDTARLALASFTDDGIFSLTAFQKAVAEEVQAFEAVGQSISDAFSRGLEEGLSPERFREILLVNFQQATRALLIDRFVTDLLEDVLQGRNFNDILTGGGTAAAELADALTEGYRRLQEMLSAAGLLAPILDDAGDSASGLADSFDTVLDKITEIDRQLSEIAQRRIDVHVNLVRNLAAIGAVGTTQRIDFEVGGLVDQFHALERAQAQAGQDQIELLDQQNGLVQQGKSLVVERYRAEEQAIQQALQTEISGIQAAGQAREVAIRSSFESQRAAIEANFDAQRAALDARAEGLRAERDAIQEASRARIDALQEELRIAQNFQQAAESVAETINSIVSTQFGFSAPEQLSFLQRQADDLRRQLASAAPDAQPELIRQLAGNLQSQLQTGVFQQPSQNFVDLRSSILDELSSLQDQALAQAGRAEQIQADILAAQQGSEQSLAAIDARIEALRAQSQILADQQQAALAVLSAQEQAALAQAAQQTQAAIMQAQAIATANIAALRAQAAQDLRNLAAIEEALLTRQAVLLEAQRATLFDQLVSLVGAEHAQQLLAARADASFLVQVQQLSVLTQISDRLAAIVPAQHGFIGTVHQPTLFLAGEHGTEDVQITPRHTVPVLPVSLHRSGSGSTTGSSSGGQIVLNINVPVDVDRRGLSQEEMDQVERKVIPMVRESLRRGLLHREVRR